MHEAAVAAGLIEVAEEHAQGRPIVSIQVRLGEFTGIVREALEFAFEALRGGTLAACAQLQIEVVPLVGRCPDCSWTGPPEHQFCLVCPTCSSPVEIVSGRELQVEYIDVDPLESEAVCES